MDFWFQIIIVLNMLLLVVNYIHWFVVISDYRHLWKYKLLRLFYTILVGWGLIMLGIINLYLMHIPTDNLPLMSMYLVLFSGQNIGMEVVFRYLHRKITIHTIPKQ